MSLLAVAEKTLADIEAAALADAKGLLTYIDNIVVVDIEPALAAALKNALGVLTQDALAAIIGSAAAASPNTSLSAPTPDTTTPTSA